MMIDRGQLNPQMLTARLASQTHRNIQTLQEWVYLRVLLHNNRYDQLGRSRVNDNQNFPQQWL
jgi:hypothetical protein